MYLVVWAKKKTIEVWKYWRKAFVDVWNGVQHPSEYVQNIVLELYGSHGDYDHVAEEYKGDHVAYSDGVSDRRVVKGSVIREQFCQGNRQQKLVLLSFTGVTAIREFNLAAIPKGFQKAIGLIQGLLKMPATILGICEALLGKGATYSHQNFCFILREISVLVLGLSAMGCAATRNLLTHYLMPISILRKNLNFGVLTTSGLHIIAGVGLYNFPYGIYLISTYGATLGINLMINFKKTPMYEFCSNAKILQSKELPDKLKQFEFNLRMHMVKTWSGKLNYSNHTYCGEEKIFEQRAVCLHSDTESDPFGILLMKDAIDEKESGPLNCSLISRHPAFKPLNIPDENSSWLEVIAAPIAIPVNFIDALGSTVRILLVTSEGLLITHIQSHRHSQQVSIDCETVCYTMLHAPLWLMKKLVEQFWAPIDSFQVAWKKHWILGVLSAGVSITLQSAALGALLPALGIPASILLSASTLSLFNQVAYGSGLVLSPLIDPTITMLGATPSITFILIKVVYQNTVYYFAPPYHFVPGNEIQNALDAANNGDLTVRITTERNWDTYSLQLNSPRASNARGLTRSSSHADINVQDRGASTERKLPRTLSMALASEAFQSERKDEVAPTRHQHSNSRHSIKRSQSFAPQRFFAQPQQNEYKHEDVVIPIGQANGMSAIPEVGDEDLDIEAGIANLNIAAIQMQQTAVDFDPSHLPNAVP